MQINISNQAVQTLSEVVKYYNQEFVTLNIDCSSGIGTTISCSFEHRKLPKIGNYWPQVTVPLQTSQDW